MNKSNKKKMIKIVLWGHDFYGIGIDFDIDPIFFSGPYKRSLLGPLMP